MQQIPMFVTPKKVVKSRERIEAQEVLAEQLTLRGFSIPEEDKLVEYLKRWPQLALGVDRGTGMIISVPRAYYEMKGGEKGA